MYYNYCAKTANLNMKHKLYRIHNYATRLFARTRYCDVYIRTWTYFRPTLGKVIVMYTYALGPTLGKVILTVTDFEHNCVKINEKVLRFFDRMLSMGHPVICSHNRDNIQCIVRVKVVDCSVFDGICRPII